jgi:hypothetical protein
LSVEAAGDYTPFGYLRNPHHHVITWWAKCTGGNLRTADETLGLEWVYPWHKDRAACAGISLVTSIDGRVCRLRSDFAGLGYTSRHHSADVLGFDWSVHEVGVAARFFLVDAALCVRVRLANLAPDARRTRIGVFGRAWTRDGAVATRADASGVVFEMPADGPAPRAHALVGSERSGKPSLVEHDHEMWAGWDVELQLGAGEHAELVAALGRGAEPTAAYAAARGALAQARPTLQRRLAEDSAFRAACPRLTGDWPADWPNGLVYDLETTRALVRPAAGIFSDVWPAWMAAWPRVVLAEASLDMLRLTLADPGLAERALLSLFRDAPLPNVPCVLEDGSDTMVAADGSRCGTSPAWCLPFLNIELVYLRTLDRAWLAELYPHLAAYVAWWLEHRTDGRGWLGVGRGRQPATRPQRIGARRHLRPRAASRAAGDARPGGIESGVLRPRART